MIISVFSNCAWKLHDFSHKYTDRKSPATNFKAAGQTQAELHILKSKNECMYIIFILQIQSHIAIERGLFIL